jgi:hypothetical protein
VSLLRPRKNARHAKPSVAAPVVAAGTLTTTLVVLDGALLSGPALADAAPTPATFDRLAQCESGGQWNINTGNGYYGGLQFSLPTWRSLGYSGLPSAASRETQIAAGQQLQARSGWGQWPACARSLGLFGATPSAASAPAAPAPAAHAPAPVARRASRTAGTPAATGGVPFGGTVTTADVRDVRADVRAWQARMSRRGWTIAVDGQFGPQSASVARRFAAEKGLSLAPHALDAVAYRAAWTLPVT